MYKYKLYGLVLESEIEFPEFVEAGKDAETDVNIQRGTAEKEILFFLGEINHTEYTYYISEEWSFFRNDYGYFSIKNGKQ